MPLSRRTVLLITLGVGVVTVVGLVIHGPVGGVLLVLVAAMLVLLSSRSGGWDRSRGDSQAVRLGIIALVLLVAVLKFAGKT